MSTTPDETGLTPEQKIEIVSRSPEIQAATKMLIGLMEDIGAKEYVQMEFVLAAPGFGAFGSETFTLSLKRQPKPDNQQ